MESSIVEIEEKAATRPCDTRAVGLGGGNNMNHLTTATATITTATATATTTTTTLSSSSSSTSLDCDVTHHVQSPLVPQLPSDKNESQRSSSCRGPTANVLAVASRVRSHDNVSAASVPMRRHNSSQNIKQIALERKRSAGSNTLSAAAMIRAVKAANAGGDDRTGFARIYFENKTFTSSTVFKLLGSTTVLEVRKSMAAKIKIRMQDFDKYAIVVVFPTDGAGSMSARTLKDEELILPLVERLNRARSVQPVVEGTETAGGGSSTRSKAKNVARPPVKFVLKDVQGSQLDIGESVASPKRQQSDTQSINFPVLLGKGVYSGYLQKASSTDTNLWRKRWFIIKGDQLLYCKSNVNQQDVTAISLLGAVLAKAKPEVRVAFSFQLKTPRRDYELCASSKDEMVAWIHALHVQIGLCSENHRLYEAEIWITEDAVTRSERDFAPPTIEVSLLERVLSREDSLKLFRDFVVSTQYQSLLDTWIECELFRRSCIARENGLVSSAGMTNRRTAQDEWNHLKAIIRAIQLLNIVHTDELNELWQLCQTEQGTRRLSATLNSEGYVEYPQTDVIVSVQLKLFRAVEAGPFQQFILQNGYRLLLERIIGAIA
uniref:PH domain-containing protein n=1 Tax=Peronospora matthiolae TaxID=2874970 RepID=A0AAV1V302_9STRA